ncbi:MAG TPA: hypothetical protein VFG35_22960 [Actinoplanes sp.]|nr:hypothetical protein [Actinoplanes sp.]
MSLISRVAAIGLFLALLPVSPALAAPTSAVAEPHVQPVTLTPGGPEKNTLIWVRTRNVEPGTRARVEVTVDLGGATGFADVRVGPGFLSTKPTSAKLDGLVVDEPDTATACLRTGEKILCSWTATLSAATSFEYPALLSVVPKKTAKIGDTAGVTMSAKLGEGAASTGTTVFRVGEGVDLAAGADRVLRAAPGRPIKFTPAVRNAGATTIDGAVLILPADPRLLGPSSYRNCRYDFGLICTFDNALQPGLRYALAKPITLRAPADAVPGSAVRMVDQWMTKAEWAETEQTEYGTPGTGAPLTLDVVVPSLDDKPQVDVLPENNYTATTFTVTGKRRPALAAAGVRRTAAIGGSFVLSPGLANFGPGTLRPDMFPNNRLGVTVLLPANVTVHSEPENCFPGEDDVRYCLLGREVGAGQRATFPFQVTVADNCGDSGRIEFADRLPDQDGVVAKGRENAQLSVNVPGATCAATVLPITGPGAGGVALIGVLLVALGLALALVHRRSVGRLCGGRPCPVGNRFHGKWTRKA